MPDPCQHWLGAQQRHCGAVPARPYIVGLRCSTHTPAALHGHPEPGAAAYCPPAMCLCGSCPSWRPELAALDPLDIALAAQLRAGCRDPGHQLARSIATELAHVGRSTALGA